MTEAPTQARPIDDSLLQSLQWRCIGPPRGGRVVAVAGDPVNRATFYFGACAGGVWKTEDGGTYWENVSDGFFETASVGAIAVADSDPNVVYAGMGEACIRLDVTHGDGVYKSTDAGKTWTHMGLEDTRHISRVRVHPNDPDTVFVAALGHAFGPNQQRGVFKSTDGGKNWEHVLFVSENAGGADLSIDPTNPRIMYAAIWQASRDFWSLTSGGPDSGLWKSVDGGDTWEDITSSRGLPEGLKGRIGVAASGARSGLVYATVESEKAGLYRSFDGGKRWSLVSDDQDLQGRPWYYQHVFADPRDWNVVWILNYQCWKSVDGGKTFFQVNTPHGDNHDLWIDPNDTERMIEGNDGGACVSFNGGDSWSTIYNQLTGQFYHLTTDSRFPYRVYGTQQDNSAISVPSRSHTGAISWTDCYTVGSSESGYIAVHPDDPDIVISGAIGSSPGGGGNMLHYDHSTGQVRIITVWPEVMTGLGAIHHRYRFQWTYPILFSPHDSNVLYAAGNVVFRSTDLGSSWEPFTPDLTRNDESKLGPSGGPVTKDTSGAEVYATVFSFVESPHEKDLYYAGTDDGLVHISRDGGENWRPIRPAGLPELARIDMIEISPHDPATAYLSATMYKLDDYSPYLYKTNNYGASWTKIVEGLPENDFTRCIREDPDRRGLLYAGTELSAYVSLDDGESWHSMASNLPRAPVYDLQIRENELVAATHGRAFWILDDLAPLRQIDWDTTSRKFRLLVPATTYRPAAPFRARKPSLGKNYMLSLGAAVGYREWKGEHGQQVRKFLDAGANPPDGVIASYFLEPDLEEPVKLTFLNGKGEEIVSFTNNSRNNGNGGKETRQGDDEEYSAKVPAKAGMNRFVWDMRYSPARAVPGDKTTEDATRSGPLAPPGSYWVRLTVGDDSQTQRFELIKEPRVAATPEDFQKQFELAIKVRDKLSETHDAINRLRSVRSQVTEWARRAEDHPSGETVKEAADAVKEKLKAIEGELISADFKGARDRLNAPTKLNAKLAGLTAVVTCADYAPPQQAFEVLEHYGTLIDPHIDSLQDIVDDDLKTFENLIHEMQIPAIVPRTEP